MGLTHLYIYPGANRLRAPQAKRRQDDLKGGGNVTRLEIATVAAIPAKLFLGGDE